MSLYSPKIWAAVERMYFEGQHSVVEIAAHCGVSPSGLKKHATRLNWPPLNELRLSSVSSERARLRALIVKKIERLEKRMTAPDPTTDVDSATQAHEMGSLTNALEKLDTKELAWRKSISPKASTPAQVPDAKDDGESNVDSWRREIIRRIARLCAKPDH